MKSYKDLIVWQKSIRLAKEVYVHSEKFPKNEVFGLTSQMRRASISIPSNIAEGYSRGHRAEYVQFLRIALGSAAELETQFILIKELGFDKAETFYETENLLQEILRMLNKLLSSLVVKRD